MNEVRLIQNMDIFGAYRRTMDINMMKVLVDIDVQDINKKYPYDNIWHRGFEPDGTLVFDELTLLTISTEDNNHFVIKFLCDEYIKYMHKTKAILKYLGLENIYSVLRFMIEMEFNDQDLMDTIYL